RTSDQIRAWQFSPRRPGDQVLPGAGELGHPSRARAPTRISRRRSRWRPCLYGTDVPTGPARYLAPWEIGDVAGVVIAVDVIRAFTTAAYAFHAGADRILL